ncbi:hypothetical protein J5N97_027854 [Dioscorea zingiberensis]|uniref:Uncharacterized protein n=1 Tax=Dioscorea zingiberensis TaxID=325984 RepID=A0A9D5H492_9LILI|nr:hypothetical protein J5N97_027854 [Dioscorea zingiberensis]
MGSDPETPRPEPNGSTSPSPSPASSPSFSSSSPLHNGQPSFGVSNAAKKGNQSRFGLEGVALHELQEARDEGQGSTGILKFVISSGDFFSYAPSFGLPPARRFIKEDLISKEEEEKTSVEVEGFIHFEIIDMVTI